MSLVGCVYTLISFRFATQFFEELKQLSKLRTTCRTCLTDLQTTEKSTNPQTSPILVIRLIDFVKILGSGETKGESDIFSLCL